MATTAFEYFLGREQSRMVRFLERNESFSTFVEALLAHLTKLAEERGCRPEDIELLTPFVQGEYIQARFRVKA